jgi:hypothetical protein
LKINALNGSSVGVFEGALDDENSRISLCGMKRKGSIRLTLARIRKHSVIEVSYSSYCEEKVPSEPIELRYITECTKN